MVLERCVASRVSCPPVISSASWGSKALSWSDKKMSMSFSSTGFS